MKIKSQLRFLTGERNKKALYKIDPKALAADPAEAAHITQYPHVIPQIEVAMIPITRPAVATPVDLFWFSSDFFPRTAKIIARMPKIKPSHP
ncbi:hypothetical protein [uncultured Fibrobacter sp.]|uniref:hypothetical protein n=1 Tax=uncultured Fibrobacter sp. TaxID=261512 RepID=UPI002805E231|nr:hypothetical protein [uncultured Fibrobacter sp.]